MHKTLRLFAGYYRKTARAAVVVMLLLSIIAPVFAQSQQPQQLTLSVSNVKISPATFGQFTVSGTVTVSGPSQGQWSGPPLTFSGWAYVSDNYRDTANLTLSPQNFDPASLNYPSPAISNFSVTSSELIDLGSARPFVKVNAYQNGQLVGTTTTTLSSNNNPTYQYIVELPLFNDTMLGASPSCHPSDPNVGFMYPCSLPLDTYYNYIAFVAVVVAGIALLVSLASAQVDERQGRKNHILDLVITVVFVFAFPAIYNNIALLMNYLNASVIAGPSSPNVAADLSNHINTVWATATPSTVSFWNLIFGNSLLTFAGWLISLFVYIGVYVLGIIRLWLLAVMIVAFPISLAIREIPFAKKLSQMIDDTFYGIVLASLMSAIVIGVAASIIGPNGNLSNGTIFGSGSGTFVASMALLTAIFMPTILAPLTGTLMQTGMQMSMAAGSVATLTATGGVSGAAGGIGGAINPSQLGASAFKSGAINPLTGKAFRTVEEAMAHFAPMSIGQRLAASMQHGTFSPGLTAGAAHGFKNIGLGLMTGVLGGMGMTQTSKALSRIAPMSSPSDVSRGMGQAAVVQGQAQQAAQNQQLGGQLVASITDTMPILVGTSVPAPEGLRAFDPGRNAPPASIQNLQRLVRSDDFNGAYNYVYEHRGAWGVKDMPDPASASQETKAQVGAHFIQALRPYKDDEAVLGRIVTNLNTAHAGRPDRGSPAGIW